MRLGGDNFDQILVDQVVRHVNQEHGIDPTKNTRFMVQLIMASRNTKERLSNVRSADLIVASPLINESGDLIDIQMEITREEYERMIRPLVDRTVGITQRALKNAGYTPEQIDCVLMAGDSTRIPLVHQAVQEMFGSEKVMRNVHPKHSVALGAAMLAARLSTLVCEAPDPTNAKPECGHVNPLDATACGRCGGIAPRRSP